MRSLGARFALLALAQLAVFACVALYIAFLTRPDHDGHDGHEEPSSSAQPGPRPHGPPPHQGWREHEPPLHGPPRGAPPAPDPQRPPQARTRPPTPLFMGPLLTLLAGAVVFAAGGFLTARWIVRPLRRLNDAARAFGAGQLGARANLQREDELGEVAQSFDEMADRIAHLLRVERELMANVSHELRTPLARIRVAVELAAEGRGDAEETRETLSDIAVDLDELESIVGDVLMTARLDALGPEGAFPIGERRRVPLVDVVEHAVRRCRTRYPERPIALHPTVLGAAAPEVLADERLLRRALENLIDNAHKYTPDAGSPIDVSIAADAAHLRIEVRDRGMGIAPEDLTRVREPFYRADRSRSRGTGGVGLGLSLVDRVVAAHAGTLSLESALGAGTTVRVTLPRCAAAHAEDDSMGPQTDEDFLQ